MTGTPKLLDVSPRLAASGVVRACSLTKRAACSRNSFVDFCRGHVFHLTPPYTRTDFICCRRENVYLYPAFTNIT